MAIHSRASYKLSHCAYTRHAGTSLIRSVSRVVELYKLVIYFIYIMLLLAFHIVPNISLPIHHIYINLSSTELRVGWTDLIVFHFNLIFIYNDALGVGINVGPEVFQVVSLAVFDELVIMQRGVQQAILDVVNHVGDQINAGLLSFLQASGRTLGMVHGSLQNQTEGEHLQAAVTRYNNLSGRGRGMRLGHCCLGSSERNSPR